MSDSNTNKQQKRLSIVINPSVEKAINELAMDRNISLSAGIRYLINLGLKENGINVRGNEVVH